MGRGRGGRNAVEAAAVGELVGAGGGPVRLGPFLRIRDRAGLMPVPGLSLRGPAHSTLTELLRRPGPSRPVGL